MKKKELSAEINDFLGVWQDVGIISFLKDIIPLFELFDLEDDSTWETEGIGSEDERNVILIRAVYIMSKICDNHAGRICSLKAQFKNLWKRMENEDGEENKIITEANKKTTEAGIIASQTR